MCIHSIKRELRRSWEADYFRPGFGQFTAHSIVLELRNFEIDLMMKAQLSPPSFVFDHIPSGVSRRTDRHSA